MRTCSVAGCAGVHEANGLCNKHYLRLRHSGRVDLASTEERFWAKVAKSGECWNWTGAKTSLGYGKLKIGDQFTPSHRYSFELSFGEIAEGMDIDHMCHNPSCVRPEHLQVIDRGSNCENRKGAQSNSATGIRGVSWDTKTSKWIAQASRRGVRHIAGYFTDIHEAESAAIALRNQLFTNNLKDRKAA